MLLMDMTVKDFASELASSSPAPGGGTIAAVSGSFAAGLGSMICALTLNRPKDPTGPDQLPAAMERFHQIRARMVELADEDTAAFNRVMEAFQLPKNTDAEKTARKAKIAEATLYAAQVPMETAGLAVEVCRLLRQAAAIVNDNVLSDCGVGIECARTAALGAFMNVSINLPGVKDEAQASALRERLDSLRAELEDCYASAARLLKERGAC